MAAKEKKKQNLQLEINALEAEIKKEENKLRNLVNELAVEQSKKRLSES